MYRLNNSANNQVVVVAENAEQIEQIARQYRFIKSINSLKCKLLASSDLDELWVEEVGFPQYTRASIVEMLNFDTHPIGTFSARSGDPFYQLCLYNPINKTFWYGTRTRYPNTYSNLTDEESVLQWRQSGWM